MWYITFWVFDCFRLYISLFRYLDITRNTLSRVSYNTLSVFWYDNKHSFSRLIYHSFCSFTNVVVQMILVNLFSPEYVLWNGAGKRYWTLTRPVHVKRSSNVCVSGQKCMVWQFQLLCYFLPVVGTTCFSITLRQDFNGSCLSGALDKQTSLSCMVCFLM